MAEHPIVTVIIPTFNNRFLVELCLRSMRCCTGRPFRVIVRDNGSTDGTLEYVRQSGLVDLILERTDNDIDNVEFKAYDDTIRNHVDTPYFLVCHSDIVILEPDWVDAIRACAVAGEANVLGGRVFPSSYSGKWIFGRWLSPWFAWGRTEAFRRLDLTWRRQFPNWCAQHLSEVREYFDETLIARYPGARLFWEHGGYLVSRADRHGAKIVNRQPAGVFHIGDMTGSILKGIHHPGEADVQDRVVRATTMHHFIGEILSSSYPSDGAFLHACRKVTAFALEHDRAILKEFRS